MPDLVNSRFTIRWSESFTCCGDGVLISWTDSISPASLVLTGNRSP